MEIQPIVIGTGQQDQAVVGASGGEPGSRCRGDPGGFGIALDDAWGGGGL